MGTYIQSEKSQRSLRDALEEAEEDHHLDCPTADFWVRAGATLLDLILFFLLNQALLHIAAMIVNYAIRAPADAAEAENLRLSVNYIILVSRLLIGYWQFCWPVSRFGGSPAKLLLGLRVLDHQTGRRLSGPRVLFRELIGKPIGLATLGIGLVMPLYRPDRRALHDLLCGSVVKKVRVDF